MVIVQVSTNCDPSNHLTTQIPSIRPLLTDKGNWRDEKNAGIGADSQRDNKSGRLFQGETAAAQTGAATETAMPVGQVRDVSNLELQGLLAKGVTLVDIRLPEEWQQTGVVEGSKLLTLFERNGAIAPGFLTNLQKIAPADKPVALICRTGNRTHAGTQMLVQAGYKQVYNVTHGITGWIGKAGQLSVSKCG